MREVLSFSDNLKKKSDWDQSRDELVAADVFVCLCVYEYAGAVENFDD